jgi:hypothetical protein
LKKTNTKSEIELKASCLIDCSPREVQYRDIVDVICACGEIGKSTYGNTLTRLKQGNPGWRCKKCVNLVIAEKQSKKVGELNPFYGKKHTKKTKDRIKATRPQALEKSKKTNQAKYGSDFATQTEEVKERTKKTNQNRYGSDWFMGTELFREKSTQTLLNEYGTDNARKLPETVAAARQTMLGLYGTDSFSKTEQFRELMSKNHHSKKQAWRDKYSKFVLSDGRYLADVCNQVNQNISNGARVLDEYGEKVFLEWIEKNHQTMNNLERYTLDLFTNAGLSIERWNKKPLEADLPYRPDFRIACGNSVVYVNSDGLFWHSQKDDKYHQKIRKDFEGVGLRLIQFRSDELTRHGSIVVSMVKAVLGLCKRMYARECEFVKVRAVVGKKFLEENHLMGAHNTATHFGLERDGKLVACMSIRRKGKGIEISRFASLVDIVIVGGFSKILNHVIELYRPESVLSYCDLRYSTGRSYLATGFNLASETLGYCWSNSKEVFDRSYCRANMDERKLTEREHAKELKIFKFFDAGQAKFVKNP